MAKTMPVAPVVTAGEVNPYLKQQASTSRAFAEQKELSATKEAAATGRTAMQTSAQRDVANIQAMAQRNVAQTQAGAAAMRAGSQEKQQTMAIRNAEKQRVWQEEQNEMKYAHENYMMQRREDAYNTAYDKNEDFLKKIDLMRGEDAIWDDFNSAAMNLPVAMMLGDTAKKDTEKEAVRMRLTRMTDSMNQTLDMINEGIRPDATNYFLTNPLTPPTSEDRLRGILVEEGEDPIGKLQKGKFDVYFNEAMNNFGLADKGVTVANLSRMNIRRIEEKIADSTIRKGDLIELVTTLDEMLQFQKDAAVAVKETKGFDKDAHLYYARRVGELQMALRGLRESKVPVKTSRTQDEYEDPILPKEGERFTVGDMVSHSFKLLTATDGKSLLSKYAMAANYEVDQLGKLIQVEHYIPSKERLMGLPWWAQLNERQQSRALRMLESNQYVYGE